MMTILKHTSHQLQEAHFATAQQASHGFLYGCLMAKNREPPRETFVKNLRMLLDSTGWSNRELSRQTRNEVSDRQQGMQR